MKPPSRGWRGFGSPESGEPDGEPRAVDVDARAEPVGLGASAGGSAAQAGVPDSPAWALISSPFEPPVRWQARHVASGRASAACSGRCTYPRRRVPEVDEALLDEVGGLIEQAPQKQRSVLTQPEIPWPSASRRITTQ